jgi:hypothetical protein
MEVNDYGSKSSWDRENHKGYNRALCIIADFLGAQDSLGSVRVYTASNRVYWMVPALFVVAYINK